MAFAEFIGTTKVLRTYLEKSLNDRCQSLLNMETDLKWSNPKKTYE